MNIMMFNGLLHFLLIMWTSAETVPETERTRGHQVYANESLVGIHARKWACENLGGKCVKKRKDCPSSRPLETEPGKPFCSRNHRCCYPGPSCSLAWDYEEHPPLIMTRETKTIVPPVDKDISDDPSRIQVGHKLVFACPGKGNEFNHVEGIHSKLHGECVTEDRFKVCVNNNPVYLDLSELSCTKKKFPTFIKQDNGTSDDNGCDELGGELYKQGYSYGDYHEFKDLDIDVCFRENNVNKSTLCTTSNLNGNETDYTKTADLTGRDTRMPSCGCVPPTCNGPINGDKGFCKSTDIKPIKPYQNNIGRADCSAECTCYMKGLPACVTLTCHSGVQTGTCKRTQEPKQVWIGKRQCGDCGCYKPAVCTTRDCRVGGQQGICSESAQGIYSVGHGLGQNGCAAGCQCFTKAPSKNALTNRCNDKNDYSTTVWGKHVCVACMQVDKHGGTITEDVAKQFATDLANGLQGTRRTAIATMFAAGRPDHIEFEHTRTPDQINGGDEDSCRIIDSVQAWQCKLNNQNRYNCKADGKKTGILTVSNGHLV